MRVTIRAHPLHAPKRRKPRHVLNLALFFILGFLVAAGLALAIMPMLWRRAGALMRKRIEASMPLSREELQAQIDAVNAEHAMAMRRLEMKAEAIKRKAAEDFVEIHSLREQVKQIQEHGAGRDETFSRLEQEREDFSAALANREAELEKVSARLAEAEQKLAKEEAELQELSESYEEASLTSSSRQVELLARETDVARLNDEISRLQAERKNVERSMHEAMAEKTQIEAELRAERKRIQELERKLERVTASLSARDEKLDRRQKEIARLKQKIREDAKAGQGGDMAEVEKEKSLLETQVADLKLQLSTVLANGGGEGSDAPASKKPEVERLRSRLTTIMRENKKLRAELAGGNGAANEVADDTLRDQIADLAAEVVNMAAALEGPDSPIEKNLAEAPTGDGDGKAASSKPSLAERVRALRQKSAAAE